MGPNPTNMTGVLIRRGSLDIGIEGEHHVNMKTAACKPRRETSEENNPAGTLISDF